MTRKMWVVLLIILSGLAFLGSAIPAQAQEVKPTPSDNEVNSVAKQMYCPVCENIPLDVCPTTACREWRELIRQKLAEGWSEEQIKDYFAVQYGDRVLSEPPRRGLNWLVYVLPAVFFLIGVGILWRVLYRTRKPVVQSAETPPTPTSSPSDPYLARLEEELRQKKD